MLKWRNNRIYTQPISVLIICILVSTALLGFFIFNSATFKASTANNIDTRSRYDIIISSDTTWTLANSPYNYSKNVIVQKGVTLSIEAGVVVKFGNGNYLQIEGKLIAEGTESKIINFTSNKGSPSPGSWDAIKFMGNADNGSSIKYCRIEYAVCAIRGDASASFSTAPNITYSEIKYCDGGIFYRPRYPKMNNSNPSHVIKFNSILSKHMGIDILAKNADVLISNNSIDNFEDVGLAQWTGINCTVDNGNVSIIDNTISGFRPGIWVANAWNAKVDIKYNIISNNNWNGIIVANHKNDGVDSLVISNNIIRNNEQGIYFFGAVSYPNIYYNNISYNSIGIHFRERDWQFHPYFYQFHHNNIFNNTNYNI